MCFCVHDLKKKSRLRSCLIIESTVVATAGLGSVTALPQNWKALLNAPLHQQACVRCGCTEIKPQRNKEHHITIKSSSLLGRGSPRGLCLLCLVLRNLRVTQACSLLSCVYDWLLTQALVLMPGSSMVVVVVGWWAGERRLSPKENKLLPLLGITVFKPKYVFLPSELGFRACQVSAMSPITPTLFQYWIDYRGILYSNIPTFTLFRK